jgi:hypothetical protein
MVADPICSIWIAPRIWFDEVERIGMQRCTPVGYVINGLGGIFWLVGILAFLGMPAYLAYRGFAGSFFWSLLWLLAVPFLIILGGSFLIAGSWTMAYRKKFYNDYERRQSTWIEAGEKRTYSVSDWQAAEGRRIG